MTEAEQTEAEILWSILGEGLIHPDITAADLPELRRLTVRALTD